MNSARTCALARHSALSLGNMLRERELIDHWLDGTSIDQCFQMCSACRKARGAQTAKPNKHCQGWKFAFRGRTALKFRPTKVEGREYSVTLTAIHDCLRDAKKDWEQFPMNACSPAVEVRDLAGTLLTRQHVDLANPKQPGPVWHLQLGGLPSERKGKHALEHLDVPRWPCMPLDFVLAAELILHSFYHDEWRELSESASWRKLIDDSESHMLGHYVSKIASYWDQRSSHASWLSAQCNTSSSWNPRPR